MIYCIIPHYGDNAQLEAAQKSVQAQTCLNLGLTIRTQVIDNNPPNPNRLFTGACNAGLLNAVMESGAKPWDVVWLLNNDAVADPECAAEALRCMFDTERCGIVASRNVDPANADHIVWGGSGRIFPAGQHKGGSVFRGDLAQRSFELWVTFASVFVSMRMIYEIGILDPNLAHICSDSDYCLRAAWNGWTSVYEPRSVVRHAHQSSSKPPDMIRARMDADSRLLHWKWMYGWFGIPRLHFPPMPELVPGCIEPIEENKDGTPQEGTAAADAGTSTAGTADAAGAAPRDGTDPG
jgi:GT2 family glycosyltransferase